MKQKKNLRRMRSQEKVERLKRDKKIYSYYKHIFLINKQTSKTIYCGNNPKKSKNQTPFYSLFRLSNSQPWLFTKTPHTHTQVPILTNSLHTDHTIASTSSTIPIIITINKTKIFLFIIKCII